MRTHDGPKNHVLSNVYTPQLFSLLLLGKNIRRQRAKSQYYGVEAQIIRVLPPLNTGYYYGGT